MPQRNLLILLVAIAIAYACFLRGEQNPYARYVSQSLEEIEAGALEKVPREELFNSAVRSMVETLRQHGDQHSQFFPRREADPFQAEMQRQFGGIGVRIRILGEPPELLVIGSPDPGTPAARAGIRANDRVLEINDEPTKGMTITDVLEHMRGQAGEPLQLLIRHADAEHPEKKDLVREIINVDSILGDRRSDDGDWEFRLEQDPRIALVRVTTFGNKTTEELHRVLSKLVDEGVEGVVLDLRDDAGGSLDAAVAICDMFLPKDKTIVEIRGRDDELQEKYVSTGKGQFAKLPLAVLVNSGSASASEILAACLQDNDRAVVLGERSYGKGTVQKLIPIESGRSLLKLTTANYRRPNGHNIHRASDAKPTDEWGVMPNSGFDVPLSKEEYAAYVDYRSGRDLWGDPPPKELLAATVAPEEAPEVANVVGVVVAGEDVAGEDVAGEDVADEDVADEGVADEGVDATAAKSTEGAAADEPEYVGDENFVDRPLGAAVEHLQSVLGSLNSA
jgi:carboxyl-terminal processing protease